MSVAHLFERTIYQNDGCWIYTGPQAGEGYGVVSISHRRLAYAHRLAYEIAKGPIPPGLEIDHLCRVRRCVNPEHLEAVTQAENYRRAHPVKTHCPRGHEYTPENTHTDKTGSRHCRACDAARHRLDRKLKAEREQKRSQ